MIGHGNQVLDSPEDFQQRRPEVARVGMGYDFIKCWNLLEQQAEGIIRPAAPEGGIMLPEVY